MIVIGSMISLGYYLPVIAAMWMREAPAAGGAAHRRRARPACPRSPADLRSSTTRSSRPAPVSREVVLVAVLAGAATIFFGIVPQPLFDLVQHAGVGARRAVLSGARPN